MASTTTYDVCTVDRAGNGVLGTAALAPASGRPALLTGGPRIAPTQAGPGGEVRPQRAEDGLAGLAERRGRGRATAVIQAVEGVPAGRGRRTTTARPTPLALPAGAVLGTSRHLRSCGTPVPGSAASDTAP